MTKRLTIGWKVTELSNRIASIRYRALFPLLALQKHEVESRMFATATADHLEGLDVLVIVKAFTVNDVALIQAAADKGIPVIFDLCDNVFIDSYNRNGDLSPAPVLRRITPLLSAIVVTTQPLADVVHMNLGTDVPVHIIPDGIEYPELVSEAYAFMDEAKRRERALPLAQRIRHSPTVKAGISLLRAGSCRAIANRIVHSNRVRRVGRALLTTLRPAWWLNRAYIVYETTRAHLHGRTSCLAQPAPPPLPTTGIVPAKPGARGLLWFGNHGAPHGRFGMIDLVDIREDLERIAAEFDVELIVISNSLEKYAELIHPLRIPSRYVAWSSANVQQELHHAAAVLVPNSLDAFSLCKSANRTLLALRAKVPVVATYTPALEPLRHCIYSNGFYAGIAACLSDTETAIRQADEGCNIANSLFSQETIAREWLNVLQHATSRERRATTAKPTELLLIANLVQDVELLAPLVAAARAREIETAVWANAEMVKRWPYTWNALLGLQVPVQLVNDDAQSLAKIELPEGLRALLTIAETNLDPHRLPHQLTRKARKAGLVTGTLQHGYENVGLTYTDSVHAIDKIEFAAAQIFTWSPLDQLHSAIRPNVRARCIPVGTSKPPAGAPRSLPPSVPQGKPIIGIFENLHWHRFSDAYREFYLRNTEILARAFPEAIFIVKPHNAGRWLTSRYKGELTPRAGNLLIADPADPEWGGVTANDLLGHMSGVVTSPSTVALDAARAGLPVAVVAYDLTLENYAPLTRIVADADWPAFVNAILGPATQTALIATSRNFVDRVLIPGDAASRIIERMFQTADTAIG